MEGALPPEKLRRRLRVDQDVPFFSARAVHSLGVKETLIAAMKAGMETLVRDEIVPLDAAYQSADNLFDHVLTFEDHPHDDEPVDAEELHIAADDTEHDQAEVAAHLAASSLDALEERARRAAERAAREAAGEPAAARVPRSKKSKPRERGAS